MRRLHPKLFAGALALGACATPSSISLNDLRPGEFVHARQFGAPVSQSEEWQLVRLVSGTVEVRAANGQPAIRLPIVGLERLQVIRGRSRGKGAAAGALAGGLGGIVIGMICQARCKSTAEGQPYYAPLAGFVIGVPVGTAIGVILSPARWLDVQLR